VSSTSGTEFPRLLSPISVKNVEIRNRLVFQPHFTALSDIDGMPTEDLRAYHVERAIGGVGLIIDGSMAVMPEGKMSRRFLHAWDKAIVPFYQKTIEEVHRHGAKMFAQLTHAGHTSLEHPPGALWAPTQLPEPYSNFTTRAMDEQDIRRTIKAFGTSAANLLDAGLDGIEIKVAHDGLLRSFASPFFNRRTDAYGGSFENRMRLSVEVLEAIRTATDGRCPIGVRLCLHEYTPFGYDLDYGLRMAEHLELTGLVDYFNCDAGSYSSYWMEIPPAAIAQGSFRSLNQALKKVSDLPIIAFGRIRDPDLAEHMLAQKETDMIGMARQLIADPETPAKLIEGRAHEIRACIACNDGCNYQVMQEKGVRCIHNPGAGRERFSSERLIRRADRVKTVVVVGGGPAGLKVAEISARRGHRVTLLERDHELGGQVRLGARQPLHEELAEVTAYLSGAVARAGADVRLGVRADAQSVLDLSPDVVVVATGSQPNLPYRAGRTAADPMDGNIARDRGLQIIPDIPGLDAENVYSSDEVLGGAMVPGGRIVVIDGSGHWEAAGTAEYLAETGCEVHVVTNRQTVGSDLEATNHALFLKRAAEKKIAIYPQTTLQEIRGTTVELFDALAGEQRVLEDVDAIVPVFTRRSRDDLYFSLLDRLENAPRRVRLERVGDAAAPSLIQNVLTEAQALASCL
jgi:2,4-dienoyl-CoA reductase-like NADH-dependent reductase (Old Yellow Enzyme family)